MKLSMLALIGTTGAFSLEHAQRVIRMHDFNGDGCLEWGEFNTAVLSHYQRAGKKPCSYQCW